MLNTVNKFFFEENFTRYHHFNKLRNNLSESTSKKKLILNKWRNFFYEICINIIGKTGQDSLKYS